MWLAPRSPLALKVIDHGPGIQSEVTKVYHLASLLQEKHAIELLKEEGRGLVDSAKDGLALVGEFPEEVTDGPGCLTVEARSGFVEEEKQFGLRGEFDTNCETLALLSVET